MNRRAIRDAKLKKYNPNDVGVKERGIFGFPFEREESDLVLLPVAFDMTTSFRPGTSLAPAEILVASTQLDTCDPSYLNVWHRGIYMDTSQYAHWLEKNKKGRAEAEEIINTLEAGEFLNDELQIKLSNCNKLSQELNTWVKNEVMKIWDDNRLMALVGGDHSTPLGMYEALTARYGSFGILQIDAHCDLRKAYEGFTYSHASIMFNALQLSGVSNLVQVGVRDYCEEEYQYIKDNPNRVHTFFDKDIKNQMYRGTTWDKICDDIIHYLPDKVHISFDIDGLIPYLCPDTGTPVAGGFELEQIHYLFEKMISSGKQLVGFDLVEVGSNTTDPFNANVGARALLKLCILFLHSNT